jgi:hypothetical protein
MTEEKEPDEVAYIDGKAWARWTTPHGTLWTSEALTAALFSSKNKTHAISMATVTYVSFQQGVCLKLFTNPADADDSLTIGLSDHVARSLITCLIHALEREPDGNSASAP